MTPPDPRTAEERLPLSDDEIARLRVEAEAEQHYPGKHGQWERLVLRLLATLDVALAAEPVPVPETPDFGLQYRESATPPEPEP